MQTFLRGVALGMVVLALSGIQLPAQETDPLVGAWELNVAKSNSAQAARRRAKHARMS